MPDEFLDPEAPDQQTIKDWHTMNSLHPYRYCYFVAGHVILDPPAPAESSFAAPFQTVVRTPRPVTSEADTEALVELCRRTIESDIGDSYAIIDQPMLRTVTFLHLVQVDADNLDGEPINVLR